MNVEEVMQMDESVKHDLITVGQALHFFPVEDSLHKIRKMIHQEGKFVTFGYIAKTVTSNK